MPSKAARLAQEAQSILEQADIEGRVLTGDERAYVADRINRAKEHAEHEKALDELGRQLGSPGTVRTGGGQSVGAGGMGDLFIRSEGWKSVSDPSRRSQQWSTGPIDVGLHFKGTLFEGTGAPGSGSGGGLIPVPDVVPGVVDSLFQPITLEALLSAGQVLTNTVRHVIEGTATSGAAGVAEGGAKPESTLGLSTRDEPVKKIATTIVMSDEIADDSVGIQSFINSRLGLFVRIESERQLLRGTSGGNEVQGLLTSRNVPVYAGGTAAGNRAEQLFKAMNGVRGSSFVEPEWVVIHPTDYEIIRLLKDSANQYYGGGPFSGSYGAGASAAASGQVTGAIDAIWSKPAYVTAAIGAGTALIGNSQAARVWNRGGLTVEATNSHSDLFVKNLLAIRAERRLALSVFRSGAFCEVRLA